MLLRELWSVGGRSEGVDVVILRCRNLSPPEPLYSFSAFPFFASGALSDRRAAMHHRIEAAESGYPALLVIRRARWPAVLYIHTP